MGLPSTWTLWTFMDYQAQNSVTVRLNRLCRLTEWPLWSHMDSHAHARIVTWVTLNTHRLIRLCRATMRYKSIIVSVPPECELHSLPGSVLVIINLHIITGSLPCHRELCGPHHREVLGTLRLIARLLWICGPSRLRTWSLWKYRGPPGLLWILAYRGLSHFLYNLRN